MEISSRNRKYIIAMFIYMPQDVSSVTQGCNDKIQAYYIRFPTKNFGAHKQMQFKYYGMITIILD
jgi:hypothetical protein